MDYYYDPETNQLLYYEQNQKPPRKKSKFAKGFLILCATVVLAGASFGAGYGIAGNKNSVVSDAAIERAISEKLNQSGNILGLESKTVIAANAAEIESNTIKVIENLSKAVVSIDTEIRSNGGYFGFGMGAYASAGSGIIVYEDSSDVYIATNNHVIEGANKVTISLDDSTKVPASYVGSDEKEDVAVVKVPKAAMIAAGISDYGIATFANSDNLKVGQDVVAIGNSAGEGKSATKGIISAINKEITVESKTLNVLQTDAAINPGNSGGALVNMQSEVVGINTAKYSSSYSISEGSVEGMGYAIPSNTVKRLVETMIQASSEPDSEGSRPYLGITGGTVTQEMRTLYDIPSGVYIQSVIENGSAAKAGVKAGDIITEFNGKTIEKFGDISDEISANLKVGDSAGLTLFRNGSSITITVILQDYNSINRF